MSIGKRVSEAIDKMEASDAEGALFAICVAIEATAAKEFGKSGRSSYKDFIHQNLGLITNIAFGRVRILNIRLMYDHPKLEKNADGIYSLEEILYHAVRCALYHKAELPRNLQFTSDQQIRTNQGALVLPSSLIYGFIVAVVVSPANQGETTVKSSLLNFGTFPIPINKLWGRRSELLWLLDVEAEVHRIAESQKSDLREQ